MAGRPLSGVPNNFASEGTGTLNNIPLLDANFSQLVSFNNDSAIGYVNYANDTGVTNSYVVTLAAAPSAYLIGMTVSFLPSSSNTGASVINVNSLGSVSILTSHGDALSAGMINSGCIAFMIFNGTGFVLAPSPSAFGFSTSVNLTANTIFNCSGALSVAAYLGISANGVTATFTNASVGTQLTILVSNNLASGSVLNLQIFTANGSVCTPWAIRSTGLIHSDSGGNFNTPSISSGQSVALNIAAISGPSAIGSMTL
jgi:hypothetical protein